VFRFVSREKILIANQLLALSIILTMYSPGRRPAEYRGGAGRRARGVAAVSCTESTAEGVTSVAQMERWCCGIKPREYGGRIGLVVKENIEGGSG